MEAFRLLMACTGALLLALLNGCAGVAISSGTYAVKSADREALQPRAEAGDAQAQYSLGMSWCCMGPGFDTQTSTQWLCRAATHGNAEALYELGRIYQGEISRTPAPGQKLVRLLTANSSPAHALAFYTLAAHAGHAEAATRQAQLEAASDEATRLSAQAIQQDFSGQCEYDSVFARVTG